MKHNTLRIVSYNCQGLNSPEKRRDVFNYFKSKQYNILCLQDTHFTEKDEPFIRSQWGGECLFNSYLSNHRGVSILFNKDCEYKVLTVKKNDSGNLLGVDIIIEG